MKLADRIQHLRKTKGLSQEELADRIGVSRQSVSKWESEQSTPDPDRIIAMSDYFEVTTDYLLKGIEPVQPQVTETREPLLQGFVGVCAILAGIWAFAANRFQVYEILLIVLGGAAIGYGLGQIVQAILNAIRNDRKDR